MDTYKFFIDKKRSTIELEIIDELDINDMQLFFNNYTDIVNSIDTRKYQFIVYCIRLVIADKKVLSMLLQCMNLYKQANFAEISFVVVPPLKVLTEKLLELIKKSKLYNAKIVVSKNINVKCKGQRYKRIY